MQHLVQVLGIKKTKLTLAQAQIGGHLRIMLMPSERALLT
jgi:hypothetical protein